MLSKCFNIALYQQQILFNVFSLKRHGFFLLSFFSFHFSFLETLFPNNELKMARPCHINFPDFRKSDKSYRLIEQVKILNLPSDKLQDSIIESYFR